RSKHGLTTSSRSRNSTGCRIDPVDGLRGGPLNNIDSRRPPNAQVRFKKSSLAIRLLRAGAASPTFSRASALFSLAATPRRGPLARVTGHRANIVEGPTCPQRGPLARGTRLRPTPIWGIGHAGNSRVYSEQFRSVHGTPGALYGSLNGAVNRLWRGRLNMRRREFITRRGVLAPCCSGTASNVPCRDDSRQPNRFFG